MTWLIELMLISREAFVRKAKQLSSVCMFCAHLCSLSANRSSLSASFLARLLSGSKLDAAVCLYVCHQCLLCHFSHHSLMASRCSMRRTCTTTALSVWRCTTCLYAHYVLVYCPPSAHHSPRHSFPCFLSFSHNITRGCLFALTIIWPGICIGILCYFLRGSTLWCSTTFTWYHC